MGGGGEHDGAIAVARQPYAQVRIFGDIVAVPAANSFQHVASQEHCGAAQRNGKAHLAKRRQNEAKPRGIFQRETAGHPIGVGIVKVQHALHTGDLWRGMGKGGGDLFQLIGGRGVFGIPDADDAPLAKWQRIVECPGFGGDA
ncbi:hypothetical protein SHM7688_02004 [Shimia marina]|uniref:Uncharacterized protein n=1 Tax=Shimia marina TaxID=321267 RepID=A0A0P1FG24_9RHOB|nr:hypothetical protein SHM7688_02004 [Shimia marina]